MSDITSSTIRESSLRMDESQKRLCWVCFGSEQEESVDNIWVCPCQCRGTMKWVHEECLQRWIDEKQKRTNSCRVSCSQCKTHYLVSYPPPNRFIKTIERYDKLLNGSSPFLAIGFVVVGFGWCCASYSFVSICQIMGFEEGKTAIEDADPFLLFILSPTIPVSLILAKLIKWEDFILRFWRHNAFKIPRPLSYFIEQPPLKPRVNCDQILLDPGFNDPVACTRMICGALLLPTISALVGKIFFSSISGPQWRRSLVGGIAFLLVKGFAKICLRKSKFMRYSQRSIRNYVPSRASLQQAINESQLSQNSDITMVAGGAGGQESSDSEIMDLSGGDNDEISRDVRLDEDSDDDDEGQAPTRALFSMTIRI